MKKTNLLYLFVILFHTIGFAQTASPFAFDTKYYDAVNKWVTFPENEKDSTYMLCYIYIDQQAGFTVRLEENFKIENDTLKVIPNPSKQTTLIIKRLNKNTSNVAVLNTKQKKDLNLPEEPQWLSVYKGSDTDVDYLKQIGYHYNHIGVSKNAIEPLLKAYKEEPAYKGLVFELGFAYNATQQFDKAIPVLEKGLKSAPKDQLIFKELGYALINSEQFDKAEKVYLKGISIAETEAIKAEMAVNMSQVFFIQKNKTKFNKWAKITRKHAKDAPQFTKYIDYFEAELNKE